MNNRPSENQVLSWQSKLTSIKGYEKTKHSPLKHYNQIGKCIVSFAEPVVTPDNFIKAVNELLDGFKKAITQE